MKIGVPKEIKAQEYRVGLTPMGVKTLTGSGHEVTVEYDAGSAIGFSNDEYIQAGAEIASVDKVYENELIVKVKEPQTQEIPLLKEYQTLFTYLHLAPAPELTRALLERKIIGIAYETVTDGQGRLPLLIPMSEVAGRLSIQAGAEHLQKHHDGPGLLLGGVPGVQPANVVILGGGVVGTQAARMAMGLGAQVTIMDNNLDRLRKLDDLYGPLLRTRYADSMSIETLMAAADLVVGAVLTPGKQAAKLITRDMLSIMKSGSVLVDVAIDQGGCAETSHPTTHTEPTYLVDGVTHYCVANMPGAVARTSTLALTNATLPYVQALADKGTIQALKDDKEFSNGLNLYHGKVTYKAVAEDLDYTWYPIDEILGSPDTKDFHLPMQHAS